MAESSGATFLARDFSSSERDEIDWWDIISVVRVLREASLRYTASVGWTWLGSIGVFIVYNDILTHHFFLRYTVFF